MELNKEYLNWDGLDTYTVDFKEWLFRLFQKVHARIGHVEEEVAKLQQDSTTTHTFRGHWDNWTNVPTRSNSYLVDATGSNVPVYGDYIIVGSTSDYYDQATTIRLVCFPLNGSGIAKIDIYEQKMPDSTVNIRENGATLILENRIIVDKSDELVKIICNVESLTCNGRTYYSGDVITEYGFESQVLLVLQFEPRIYNGEWEFLYAGDWGKLGKNGWVPSFQVNYATGENLKIENGIISVEDMHYDDSELKERMAEAESRLTNAETRISETETRITEAESEIESAKERIASTENRLDSVESRVTTSEERISNAEERISGAESRLDDVEVAIEGLDTIYIQDEIIADSSNFQPGSKWTIETAIQKIASLFAGHDKQISDIKELIPEEATSDNKLADKNFVTTSIAQNSANFRGNFLTWALVPETEDGYEEDYVGNKKPTNNDYLVVTDAADYGEDYIGTWRFLYIGEWDAKGKSGWKPAYRIGEVFTPEQEAAINSGITSEKVAKYDNYEEAISTISDNKVDKTSEANKIYGTDQTGEQTLLDASTFVRIDEFGNVTLNGNLIMKKSGETSTLTQFNVKELDRFVSVDPSTNMSMLDQLADILSMTKEEVLNELNK